MPFSKFIDYLLLEKKYSKHTVNAYEKDRKSWGFVSRNIIKAEFESDYVIAYRFRNRLSDTIYSTDTDLIALCGSTCVSISSCFEEKPAIKSK